MRSAARLLLVVLGAVGFTANARADRAEDAERLFEQGKTAMSVGDYPAACSKFAASLRLDSGIGTMLWLADCFEHNGQTASAWEQYREAAVAAAKAGDEREKVARAKAAGIEPKLSKLRIVVAHEADGLVIDRDGISVARSLWGVELPVDPGKHTIVAKAPGHSSWQTFVDVRSGVTTVSVNVPELGTGGPSHRTRSATSDPARGRTQRTIGLVTGGVGLVALGVGTYFGLHAKSLNDRAEDHCPAAGCDEQGFGDRSDAKSSARWSTGFFAGGAVLAASGAVLYFTAPSSRSEVAFAPAVAPAAAGFELQTRF